MNNNMENLFNIGQQKEESKVPTNNPDGSITEVLGNQRMMNMGMKKGETRPREQHLVKLRKDKRDEAIKAKR